MRESAIRLMCVKEERPMAFNKGDKTDASKIRRGGMRRRKKVCVFCGEKNGEIDYKDTNKLSIQAPGAQLLDLRDRRPGGVQWVRQYAPGHPADFRNEPAEVGSHLVQVVALRSIW